MMLTLIFIIELSAAPCAEPLRPPEVVLTKYGSAISVQSQAVGPTLDTSINSEINVDNGIALTYLLSLNVIEILKVI